MNRITSEDVKAALHTSLPIMVTFVVLGAGYGLLMEKNGYGPVWSLLSGIIIFSGTVQFVSVSMLGSGSVIMAAVTALMVAARHFFFSISMIGRYRSEGKRKWYLYYALCDETYAMLSRDDQPEGVNLSAYRLLVTLFDQSSWVIGSFIGGWIGTMLNFDSTGIDFAMTALFTTVFVEQWLSAGSHIPAVLGVAATLVCRIIFGRDIFLIPAMVIIIAVLTVMRGRIERETADREAVNKSCKGEADRAANRMSLETEAHVAASHMSRESEADRAASHTSRESEADSTASHMRCGAEADSTASHMRCESEADSTASHMRCESEADSVMVSIDDPQLISAGKEGDENA